MKKPKELHVTHLTIAHAEAFASDNEVLAIAESMKVTYGDAQWTLVTCTGFVAAVDRLYGQKRAKRVHDLLITNFPDYIAFNG